MFDNHKRYKVINGRIIRILIYKTEWIMILGGASALWFDAMTSELISIARSDHERWLFVVVIGRLNARRLAASEGGE